MKSGSWSSYRAAAEIEYDGHPDDEPMPGVTASEIHDCPGVYEVWLLAGWGKAKGRNRRLKAGLSQNMAVAIAKDLDGRYQERMDVRWRAEYEAELAEDARLDAAVEAYRPMSEASEPASDDDNPPW